LTPGARAGRNRPFPTVRPPRPPATRGGPMRGDTW
jgi:hypothetical protein